MKKSGRSIGGTLPERYVPGELRQNIEQSGQQIGDAQVEDEEVHPGELPPLVPSSGVQGEQDQSIADDRGEKYAGQYCDLPSGEVFIPQVLWHLRR